MDQFFRFEWSQLSGPSIKGKEAIFSHPFFVLCNCTFFDCFFLEPNQKISNILTYLGFHDPGINLCGGQFSVSQHLGNGFDWNTIGQCYRCSKSVSGGMK